MDLLENELLDMRTNFIRLCYSPDFVSTPWGFWGAGSPPDPGAVPPHGGALGHLPVRGDAPGFGGLGGAAPPSCAHPAVQEKLKPAYLEQLPKKLQELSRFLGSGPWFAGQKVGGGCWGGMLGSPCGG